MNILQAEIRCKKRELTRNIRHHARLCIALKNGVSRIVHIRLLLIISQIAQKSNNNVTKRHTSKLNRLRDNKRSRKPDSVTNLSSRILITEEHHALANGLHHVYPLENFDHSQFVCNMEYFYARLLNVRTTYRHYEQKPANMKVLHELSSTQLQVASQLRSIANTVRRTAQVELKQIGKEHRHTFQVLRSLANDRSIMISKPDKGRGVVVMDRADYLRKMYTIIDDPSTFRAIDTDTTMKNEDRLTRILGDLKKEEFISEGEYSLALPVGAMPARLYGLPKLHKKDVPLRPVMSATKIVGYGLGKVLTRRLNHLRQSPYVVKDSFDFVEKIKKSTNADKTMVSFDVKSLFTNVPLTYTINLILDRMYPTCATICPARPRTRHCKDCHRRHSFSDLLRAATSDIQFIFDGKTFVQHNGVAMGAPVIADIFMAHMETSLMERLEQIGVCEWHRYVDDTFVLLKPGTNIDDVLHVLNEFQPSIQFTHEPEKDNTIAFLDVQVIRTLVENKSEPIDPNEQQAQTFIFDTTIHRKETFTGLMTNWHSFVPFSYKKSSVVSMIQRALSICSTYSLLDKELLKIRTVCQDNDYPIDFIDTRIGIGLTKYLNRSNNNNNNEPNIPVSGCEKRRMYVEIPFIGKQTEIMKKKISQLTAESRPDLDIRYVAKPPPSVRTLFPTKDPVPIHLQSDVVYAVKCKECGDTYVGKTIRQCGRRLEEHGAPNRTLDRQTNIDESDDEAATSNVQSNHNPRPGRATTTTRDLVEQQPQPETW